MTALIGGVIVQPEMKSGRSSRLAVGAAIGLAGGFFGGLVGLGGGVIMIPLMTAFAGVSQHMAHGTSLVGIVFTGLAGAATYFLHGTLDWRAALLLAATAVLTARFGALYAHSLPEKKLKKAFGFFLLSVSMLLLLKGYVPQGAVMQGAWGKAGVFLTTGIFTGFLSGMMGVGGGTVMIPPMVILAGMAQHVAQGTSLLAMVPVSVTGSVTHFRLGNVEPAVAVGLAIGSTLGVYAGGTIANQLPQLYLQVIFAAVLVWMGIRYVRG